MNVSVCLDTYNHERFIAEAIEGVLSQQVDGGFELLISDDASTDGTWEIVRGFADRFPEVIRVTRSESNLNSNEVTYRSMRAARGRFIALLDGDDYWTSTDKLQRQADYLDAHPSSTMCFHQMMQVNEGDSGLPVQFVPEGHPPSIDLLDFLRRHYIAGSSPMFRRAVLTDLPAWIDRVRHLDWALNLHAGQHGSIGYLPEVTGIYRLHAGGSWSALSRVQQLKEILHCLHEASAVLGESYRRQIAAIVASRQYDLGLAYEEAGDIDAARAAVASSLRTQPVTRATTRRIWDLARLVVAKSGR